MTEIMGMTGRKLENGELEWKLRPELIEGLEDLPESGLLVTSELQVIKNLNTLEDYLHNDEFHDFAVERIRIGSTFLVYNVNRDTQENGVYYNHSKGQESCDGRARDELDIPSTISQVPQGGRVAATGGPVHAPGVLSTIRLPPQAP